jgi:hypothetical protein
LLVLDAAARNKDSDARNTVKKRRENDILLFLDGSVTVV